MAAPPDALRELLDEREIREVLARYCRGVDRLDEAMIRSCYHPDASDDHGMYKGPGVDFAAFCVKALELHAAATLHVLGQSLIEFEASGVARAETYVIAHHRCERDGVDLLETVGARYVDRFEQRGGPWKIADRVVVVDWEKSERTEPVFPNGTFRTGSRITES